MYIADLHIHSHYSMATSKQLTPAYLDLWARNKGITVVGTGDFTHPKWLEELEETLISDGSGLYILKPELRLEGAVNSALIPRFLLTAEISTIYKKKDKTRKVHHVVFVPSFADARSIQAALLAQKFNITSDGRPILGLDSRNLLEICLEESNDSFFFPAHIWTPWFSALGEKSGFDTLIDCYEDLTTHISAVETGLSTDPAMNRMVSFLDRFTLLSNSDAHSPEKLGRNANILHGNPSYHGLVESITSGAPEVWGGTIDMFPQEGKYHYAGHRKCGVCWNPLQTEEHHGICPVCGKRVTSGVMNRIAALSDRPIDSPEAPNTVFQSIIPLKEIIAEVNQIAATGKKTDQEYYRILSRTGPELEILLSTDMEEISRTAGTLMGEAIRRMRNKEVLIKEGFDGEYGKIRLFSPGELTRSGSLFQMTEPIIEKPQRRESLKFDVEKFQRLYAQQEETRTGAEESSPALFQKNHPLSGLNPDQKAAASHLQGPALVVAGPGTGKTRVLTQRIAYLLAEGLASPEQILALTFTNKAAEEMKERLAALQGKDTTKKMQITTFHAFGLQWLKEYGKSYAGMVDNKDKALIIKVVAPELSRRDRIKAIHGFTEIKTTAKKTQNKTWQNVFSRYQHYLEKNNLFDFDDLLIKPLTVLQGSEELRKTIQTKYPWILVDEVQDINAMQYQLLKTLSATSNANLFLIGDPQQSIYGFRGADNRLPDTFCTDYNRVKVYPLTYSYRCSEKILKAAGSVLSDPKFNPVGENPGTKIHLVRTQSSASEAEYVARKIEEMIGGLRFFSMDSHISTGRKKDKITSLSDFAVLCRTSKQMEAFEKAFHDHSIPYQRIGEENWLKSEPFSSLIYALRAIYLPYNEVVNDFIKEKGIHLNPALKKGNNTEFLLRNIAKQLGQEITGYDLERMLRLIKKYAYVEEFLESAMLGLPGDYAQSGTEKVSLMTLHASKGLEFWCVFVTGVEDGLLPYALFESMETDPAEEERLLYVGMTRAKEYLYLTHATRRILGGRTYTLPLSPFVHRIPGSLIEFENQKSRRPDQKEDNQLKLF
ncbi:MAG: UvrD-helicase domain-containing protein [Bacteroidales bacterium]|nr:UvrD-helicase domain-containing protein [Bacteroidales bacterium]MDD2322651.1 UvrD-helicase domain-containing protein [Bacteroidales bacterium]MDD3961814.1 UvrD-helicase domain-containing protein [Bacteroidales bacterium]MDY0286216.1 UvrD-helicase domain-containing protein [Bacteroidales bacterium]HPE87553.1 UvrD-helicase domain-containing protein [Bacteroidales bacterium]